MKKIFVNISLLTAILLLVTGCGSAKLKNGEEKVVEFKGGKVTADTLYNSLKDKYGIATLIDLMDHELLDKEYKTTEEETNQINNQITQMKQNYQDNEEGFLTAIRQYFGVTDENELRDLLSLDYKRNAAVEDYVKGQIEDAEIEEYYNSKTIGKITARHILIKPEVKDGMSEDEKKEAEKKAEEEAKDIIKQLDEGKKFATLAKKYSDDTGTKKDGGKLEEFDNNSNMDENFLDASAKLEVGKYTKEPVKSQYGYHIILKESEKDKPKLKTVKEDIKKTLATEKLKNSTTLHYEALRDYRKEKGLKFSDSKLKKEYNKYMENLINNASQNATN